MGIVDVVGLLQPNRLRIKTSPKAIKITFVAGDNGLGFFEYLRIIPPCSVGSLPINGALNYFILPPTTGQRRVYHPIAVRKLTQWRGEV